VEAKTFPGGPDGVHHLVFTQTQNGVGRVCRHPGIRQPPAHRFIVNQYTRALQYLQRGSVDGLDICLR
jgi:hypothetical protein